MAGEEGEWTGTRPLESTMPPGQKRLCAHSVIRAMGEGPLA